MSKNISLAGEGELFELEPGSLVRFKIFARDTNGVIELYERELPAQTLGADPHVHSTTTETFYVVEGKPTILCGNVEQQFGPGSIVVVPPETVHAYRNATPDHVRVLISFSPALGHEKFFRELANLKHGPAAEYQPRLAALRERFDSRTVEIA